MSQNVIVCVDGSTFSDEALKWYAQNFYRPGHKCNIVYVPDSFVHISMMSPGRHMECKREAEQKTAATKQRYEDMAKTCKIPDTEFIAAEPKEGESIGAVIIRVSREREPLFIVAGTRGMGKIRRTILGSVSDYIVHHSHCPVLVCRHKDQQQEQQMSH